MAMIPLVIMASLDLDRQCELSVNIDSHIGFGCMTSLVVSLLHLPLAIESNCTPKLLSTLRKRANRPSQTSKKTQNFLGIKFLIYGSSNFWIQGKGLDFETIFKFLGYFTPKLIPIVLPLSILLASLMTFGSLALVKRLL